MQNPFSFLHWCSDLPDEKIIMEFTLGQFIPNHRALKFLVRVRGQAQTPKAIRLKAPTRRHGTMVPVSMRQIFMMLMVDLMKATRWGVLRAIKLRIRHTFAKTSRKLAPKFQRARCPFSMGPTAQISENKAFDCLLNSPTPQTPRTPRVKQQDQRGLEGSVTIAWSQTRILAEQMRFSLLFFFCNHLELRNQAIKP